MAETDDGRTPKIGCSTNLDAKTFVLGQGNVIGKMPSKNSLIALDL